MPEQPNPLSPTSCRAARQLLKIAQPELATLAGISVSTVRRFESGEHRISEYARKSIFQALRRGGIQFVTASGDPELK